MNEDHRFEFLDTRLAPSFQNASELKDLIARARQERAEATAAMIGAAFRGIARILQSLSTQVVRWERGRATRDALMRCSDRVLADVGIEREHIPLIAKGIDPGEHELREPALRRWWAGTRARVEAARSARRERRRIYRELDAYNDRELEQIGLRRGDIPAIARGQATLPRAA